MRLVVEVADAREITYHLVRSRPTALLGSVCTTAFPYRQAEAV